MSNETNNTGNNNSSGWIQAAATAASGLLGGLFNNKKNKEAADKQHERNIEYWNMQNAYNHPSEQMSRLRQANLNPHLIYGTPSGASVGNAGAISQNSMQKVSPLGLDADKSFRAYTDFRNTEAQTDNLRVMNSKILQEEKNVKANTAKTNIETANAIQQLDITKGQKQDLIESTGLKNDLTKSQIKVEDRKIDEIAARISKVNTEQDYLSLARDLRAMGIEVNDPIYVRLLAKLPQYKDINNLDQLMDFIGDTANAGYKYWQQRNQPEIKTPPHFKN